jgi:hypothetical protein
MYTIIEDCSPYYIRFTHDKIDEIINRCNSIANELELTKDMTHYKIESTIANDILSFVPMAQQFDILKTRVSLFITKPGYCYDVHKDGIDHRFSLNYTIRVLDNKCVTSWYSDEELKDYPIETMINQTPSRHIFGVDKEKHIPSKTVTFGPNECILFNSDLFHNWDNSQSDHERIVLTLRLEKPRHVYFEDARKIMFGF